jgi:cell division protease FtsH
VVRYSHLADVKISPEEVTGSVTRQVMEPTREDAKTDVAFHTARRGGEYDNNWLFERLKDAGFRDVRFEKAPSAWRYYMPTVVLALLLVLLFVLMLRRLGGTGSAMAFGRSRGKLYAQEDVGISFEDVAGVEEAVEELREVVDFLKTPEKYQILGGRIPKGILLVGPPGTGKTLLAKAIAGEAGVPFFSLSGSDFVEMFVGVGAARVRDMFQQAQTKAPCIVFIDELDALGKTRGSGIMGGHDEREQTLNALLVEMDGFTSNSGVIIMAATNRPETLDPALLRPGRFDRHVLVDRPDVHGREEILEVHAGKVRLDIEVDLKEVARITSGFVGADLANLVNEAALLAARAGKAAVTMLEFNEGVERVTAGLEKRQRVMHAEEKQRVAYHESAHALVAASLPNTDPVHKVSIIPRGLAALGYTMQRPEGDRYLLTQSELESRIQVLLAGTIAEEMIFGDVSTGAQNDLERATEIARSMVMDYGMSRLGRVTYRESRRPMFLNGQDEIHGERTHSQQTAREIDEEIAHVIAEALEQVRHILETRRQALVAIADRLIDQETIDNGELKRLIEANSPSPMIVPGTEETATRKAVEEIVPREGHAAEEAS